MLGKIFAGKALVAMATVALTATGAAAASGSLPAPVQDAVSGAVSHVGFDLPAKGGRSAEHRQDAGHRQSNKSRSGDDHGPSGDKGRSGDRHGQPADGGRPGDTDGNKSGGEGKGREISDLTHSPALAGRPKGPVVSDVASGGQSQAGDHGRPGGDIPADPGTDEGRPAESGRADKPTPPVTAGSKATGEERSQRDKSGGQKN